MIVYNLKQKKKLSNFKIIDLNVFLNYKAQLKAYSKKNFDPFCRRERVSFKYYNNKSVVTTVGQLNFFRWAIENGIIKYIQEHLEDIEADMNFNIKKSKNKSKSKKNKLVVATNDELNNYTGNHVHLSTKTNNRNKRRELSISAVKKLNRHK